MTLKLNDDFTLDLIDAHHAAPLYQLIERNREHLAEWLPWVAYAKDIGFLHQFIQGSQQRNSAGAEFAFVIMRGTKMTGRIGLYKVDNYNKTAEIGYWIGKKFEGKGIVTEACNALLRFAFGDAGLNRIEIKCGTANLRSNAVITRLGFKKEGIMRQGEFLGGRFIDLNLYAMVRDEAIL